MKGKVSGESFCTGLQNVTAEVGLIDGRVVGVLHEEGQQSVLCRGEGDLLTMNVTFMPVEINGYSLIGVDVSNIPR